MSRPETPRAIEDAQALADREARDKSLRDKVVSKMKKKGSEDQMWDKMCPTIKSKNESLRDFFLP